MPDTADSESVTKIISAAEELFAQQGYTAASLRQVTKRAGVNLAAVNYHFGDKPSLFRAVITRRMRPLNDARLRQLEASQQAAGPEPIALPLILEIMARPLFQLCEEGAGSHPGAQIIGRSLTEPLPFMAELLAGEFHPAMSRFNGAIRRHARHLSPEEFLWRMNYVVGAMHHFMGTLHQMKALTRGICRDGDHEGALRHFVQISTVTITAPSAA